MQGLGSVLETQDEISARPELTAKTKQQKNFVRGLAQVAQWQWRKGIQPAGGAGQEGVMLDLGKME